MWKVFALIPYMGKSDEEIAAAREEVLATFIEKTGRQAELCIPHGKRLTGDINAMFDSDVVVAAKYAEYDPVCNIVKNAAITYGKEFTEDRYIQPNLFPPDDDEIEEVPDEDVPA